MAQGMRKRGNGSSRRTGRKTPDSELSAEYLEYEERYRLFGQDRPKLSPEDFEKFDDELLDLLALEPDQMTDDQLVRLQELEFLLIDSD
jgi:hypothetical protein